MTRRGASGLLAVVIGSLGGCLAFGALVGGDPLLALELGGAALAAVWAALVARELRTSQLLSLALAADAEKVALGGVAICVTPSLGADAIVVGALRPRIFVGSELFATLSDDEMRAVVLHEDHHRRTRAPLRAAALVAWLRLLGRSTKIRGALLDRLIDLETLADTDAIHRGSSPQSLARALLKGDVSLKPASFEYAAGRRVEHLLDRAAGNRVEETRRLPYEWLPVMVLTGATVGCHVGL